MDTASCFWIWQNNRAPILLIILPGAMYETACSPEHIETDAIQFIRARLQQTASYAARDGSGTWCVSPGQSENSGRDR
jgi:hypothetical protein